MVNCNISKLYIQFSLLLPNLYYPKYCISDYHLQTLESYRERLNKILKWISVVKAFVDVEYMH